MEGQVYSLADHCDTVLDSELFDLNHSKKQFKSYPYKYEQDSGKKVPRKICAIFGKRKPYDQLHAVQCFLV